MEVAIIINPVSGGGYALRKLADVQKLLKRLGITTHVFHTQYQGHASELALSFCGSSSIKAVVAAGGDGTVNEVATGLLGSPTPLGILPLGSGNGLCRQLGIGTSLAKACQAIANGKTKLIDSGTVNGRSFFVTSGIGFDGLVAYHFASSHKRGFSTYVTSVLKLLRELKPFQANLSLYKGEEMMEDSGFYSLLVAANAQQYGNNAYIAPGALLDDGLLNLITVGTLNFVQIGNFGRRLFNKTIENHSHVQALAVTKIVVSTEKAQFFHLDGEPCGTESSFDIRVRKHSLYVLAPFQETP